MIGFLYPLLWIAALAVAVPFLLHLIRRRDIRRVVFPAVRYLRKAERRHARRLRLRHLLLLAARVALILTLAATAAGPLIGRGGAADHRPTALAIILDESQSTAQISGGRRLLDQLSERARLALELAAPDDRVALFSATRVEAPAVAADPPAILEHLASLEPVAAAADLGSAIVRADAWLASVAEGRAKEIHVLTDLQSTSLAHITRETQTADGGGTSVIIYTPDYEPAPNAAPSDAVPTVTPLNAGQATSVLVNLHRFGEDAPADEIVTRLVINQRIVAVAEGRLGGSAVLRAPPQDSGWVQGYVEIDRQGLAVDDRRYFTWFARQTPRVAAIGRVDDFVATALAALEQGGRLSRADPSAAEVWIAAEGERLEAGLSARRSVIVLPPTTPLDLPRLNLRLERARIPWRYVARLEGEGLTRIAAAAPIEGLAGLEVRQAYELTPGSLAGADTALVRTESGAPWVVRGTTPEGSAYLLLASPLTPAASALPVSAAMVPFIDAAVGDWARRGAIQPQLVDASAPLRLPARARSVNLPDGRTIAVEGGAPFRAVEAGNYAVLDEAGIALAFSVNAPLSESDLARGDPQTLQTSLPSASWSWRSGGDAAAWTDVIFAARRGRLAWRPLVALIILIAIVEASLAAAGRRRAPRPAISAERI